MATQQIVEVAIANLIPNPLNPSTRVPDKEFIESIRTTGVRTPLLVEHNGKEGKYVIIAGERRLKAAREVGLTTLPCIVQQEGTDGGALLLIDNIHRKNMNIWEEYLVINELLKTSTVPVVAKKINKSSVYVTRRAALGNLIPEVVALIKADTQGLTDRIVFVLARMPRDIQTQLYKNGTNEVEINGAKTTIWDSPESRVAAQASRLLESSLFSGKATPETILSVYGTTKKIGEVAIEKVIEERLADDTLSLGRTAKVTPEEAKETRRLLKEIGSAVRLSSNSYSYEGRLSSQQWRRSTKEDDAKTVKDGIIVDGPNAGKLVAFVEIKQKTEKEKKDNRTEAQKEKDRKERREVRLVNKSTNQAVDQLFALVYTKKAPTLTSDMIRFAITKLNQSYRNCLLRFLLEPDEYHKVTFDKAEEKLFSIVKKMDESKALFFLTFAPHTGDNSEDVASFYGMKFSDLVKQERTLILEEQRKEAEEKERQAAKAKK